MGKLYRLKASGLASYLANTEQNEIRRGYFELLIEAAEIKDGEGVGKPVATKEVCSLFQKIDKKAAELD